ncbi:MAG: ATP-binding protein [Victivallaceae bacterium]|nr:ATP-binding protein [Victivallaceae bacterium]
MIQRHLSSYIKEAATQYPIVAVTGPRQSGKTTLCRELFPDYAYVNLEKPDTRAFAIEDPNGFLAQFKKPVILDEVQRTPDLFSYIMVLADERKRMGEFILTGSQNFHLQDAISQSLAGRCAIMKLLPLSHRELTGLPNRDIFGIKSWEAPTASTGNAFEQIYRGCYPPIYDRKINPTNWLAQYTQSYLERDVRTLVNVGDLDTFEKFLRLAAGRTGQILNMDSLATDAGISPVTAKRWLSLLIASYVVFLLRPHQKNFNKRLIKSPKLYFYDTGLVCYLLNIRSAEALTLHSQRGAIFETYIVSETVKTCMNSGIEPPLYYWRDSQGHEVDLMIEDGESLFPVEIKSGQTVNSSMFEGLDYWRKLSGDSHGMLCYGGNESYTRNGIDVRAWDSF